MKYIKLQGTSKDDLKVFQTDKPRPERPDYYFMGYDVNPKYCQDKAVWLGSFVATNKFRAVDIARIALKLYSNERSFRYVSIVSKKFERFLSQGVIVDENTFEKIKQQL